MVIPEETELLGLLGVINKRLSSIEEKMIELVRLEERVNGYSKALGRFGDRQDEMETRVRLLETTQSDLKHCISSCDMSDVKTRVTELERKDDFDEGYVKLIKEIVKWVAVIATGILIYKFTRG